MTDGFMTDIITVVRSAVKNENGVLSSDCDLKKISRILRGHNLAAIALEGALLCGADKKDEAILRLKKTACTYLIYHEYQLKAVKELTESFQDNKVDFMPLKGTVLKELYPHPEWRTMTDADILIRPSQYDKISEILTSMGYTPGEESDHEYNWYKGNFHLELHKFLIPSYNEDYFAYYGDGWSKAKKSEGSCYVMNKEDILIYMFTHFAKHYRDGGIGIKHLTDLYFLTRAEDIDKAYVENELEKLGLSEFYGNILKVISCWFEDGTFDEKSRFISERIICSGSFVSAEKNELSSALRDAQKSGSSKKAVTDKKIGLFFPSAEDMKNKYPVLRKLPFLLPLFWLYRIICALPEYKKHKTKITNVGKLNEADVERYEENLAYVGLSFSFDKTYSESKGAEK